jgi:hypothetical protein
MQERDAHDGAALGVGAQAGLAVQQLVAGVPQRDAGHAEARRGTRPPGRRRQA